MHHRTPAAFALAGLGTLVCFVLPGSGATGAARDRPSSCRDQVGRGFVVAASPAALIFRAVTDDAFEDSYFACSQRTRRWATLIGSAQRAYCCDPSVAQERGARTFAIQGAAAGFVSQSCTARYNGGCSFSAASFDTRTGRRLDYFDEYDDDAPTPVRLVVTGGGQLAVSARTESTVRIYARRDPYGSPTVIDEGPGVDPHSLAVAGSRIYWTSGGATKSAILRRP